MGDRQRAPVPEQQRARNGLMESGSARQYRGGRSKLAAHLQAPPELKAAAAAAARCDRPQSAASSRLAASTPGYRQHVQRFIYIRYLKGNQTARDGFGMAVAS